MKNLSNYLTPVILILAVVGGFVLLSKPTGKVGQSNNGQQPALTQSYDFGRVSMAAGKVSHNYSLKNTLGRKLDIKKIFTSCMCTAAIMKHDGQTHGPYGMPGHGPAPSVEETVAPGEEFEVEAIFDPAAHGPAGVGKVERVVFLDLAGGEQIQLKFTAEVVP